MKNFTVRAEKCSGMRIFSLFVLILSIFTACKQPTWNDPVREYLDYYTETAAVEDFEVVQSYLVDKDGNICISSGENREILLYARNPKKFILTSDFAVNVPGTGTNTVIQDSDDPTIFHLSYSEAFLTNHERGGDIGGIVTLTEVGTGRIFEREAYSLKLRCNSPPPEIIDAAVMSMSNGDEQTFVLAFYRPGQALCRPPSGTPSDLVGIHSDIVSITINGTEYPISISSTGVMSFPDSHFTTDDLTPNLSPINRGYTHDSQLSVYFLTGEPFVEGNKSYTIGFNDEAGLSSRITVDTAVARLSAPTVVKNNDDNNLYTTSSVNYLHTDSDGAEQSTVRIFVPTDDEIGNSVSNVTLHYELYKGGYSDTVSDTVTRIVPNADNLGTYTGTNPVELELPDEDAYYLVTWASNPDHTDSVKVKYKLNLQYAQLKAPDVKDLGDNLLSATAANNYIKLDEGQLYATVKVSVPDKTTTNVAVGTGVTVHYTLCQGTEIADDADDHTITSQTSLQDTTFGQWCLKVKATKTGYRDSEEKTYLIKAFSSDIWVASTDNGGNNSTGDGTSAHPYATIQRAVTEIATYNKPTVDYTVHVSGTIKGSQTVSSALDGKTAKLTLTGESIDGILDGNKNASNKGTTLTVSTTVPVTIEYLKITGGYNQNGGGIRINQNGTVKLGNEAWVTGNTADPTRGSGGGVLLDYGAKLFVYGTALIGGSGNTRPGSDGSGAGNIARYGGGICNWRHNSEVYLGYIDENTPYPIPSGYGVRQNYSTFRGAGISSWGTLKIASGEISYNYSHADGSGIGGGIYSEYDSDSTTNPNGLGGIVDMSGGTIKGNHAEGNGGGICCFSGSFAMSGGSIESNTTDSLGGAIYTKKTFSLSGDASIPCTGTQKNNDIYISGSGVSVKIDDDDLTGAGNIWLCGNDSFYVVGNQVLTGTSARIATNYTKFNVFVKSSQDWSIIDDGTLVQAFRSFVDASNASSFSPVAGKKYYFVIDENMTTDDLTHFLTTFCYGGGTAQTTVPEPNTIGAGSVLDLSRMTGSVRLDAIDTSVSPSHNVSGGVFSNNISTIILPGGSSTFSIDWTMNIFGVNKVKEFIVSADSENYCSVDGVLYNKDKTELIRYPPSKSGTSFTIPSSVVCLSPYAFYNTTNLTQVSIPNSVTNLGYDTFCNSGLTSVNVPGSVLSLDGTFKHCTNLTTVTLNSGLKYIGTEYQSEVFEDCTSIQSINIPNTVVLIGRKSFKGCTSASLTISIPSSVKFLGQDVFYQCQNLNLSNMVKSGWKKEDGSSVASSSLTESYFTSGSVKITRNWE